MNYKKRLSILLLLMLSFAALVTSCQQEQFKLQENKKDIEEAKLFASVLAKAVSDNVHLRSFLKNEALKYFDNDFDVLYQLVKEQRLDNGITFRESIVPYFSSIEDFHELEANNPLLTIYIPELPSGFNASTWDVENDIPMVGVADNESSDVKIYDSFGEKMILPGDEIPAFPVLVVKRNERIVQVKSDSKEYLKNRNNARIVSSNNFQFTFIDDCFDGSIKVKNKNKNARTWFEDGIAADVKTKKAEALGGWHRDYIYYNLQPGVPAGKFDNNYREYITMFKFISGDGLYQISNSNVPMDPKVVKQKSSLSSPSWTDGIFEFRVNVLINSKNGAGQNIQKIFTARPEELFDIDYVRSGLVYKIKTITPKELWPYKLEIIPWNLENYGTAWKFSFEEFDTPQTITEQKSHTSKFAMNFGLDAGFGIGEIVKIGLKFGAETESTQTQTYTVQTLIESNKLGECIVDFSDPVIVDHPYGWLTRTNEYSTGSVVISLEPLKLNDPLWDWLEQ